jgi:uncharacterized protein YecE (DUF72 family)
MAKHGQLRIGTSGWIYSHWRGVFYPADLPTQRWLSFYAEHFSTVEVNNTFYRLPSAETFMEWRRQAPTGFVYAVKASRYLTHLKKLKDPAEPVERIVGRAGHLGPHLGPILYQLPPRWRCDVTRLRQFIAHLPTKLNHVFEFRDPSWCNEEVRFLLAQTGMSFCIHDMRGFQCPAWTTGPLVYIRFHGPTDLKYAGRYGQAQLRTWADRIRDFLSSGRDVYVYFNNDDQGHAVTDARELITLLQDELVASGSRQAACLAPGLRKSL